MEKTFRDLIIACTVEIVCLPIFVYIYEPNGIVFWVLLMAMDAYLLQRISFFELVKIITEERYKKERNQMLFMEVAFFIGLGIVAFQSLPLAGILLINDIIVDVLCFFQAMSDKKSK